MYIDRHIQTCMDAVAKDFFVVLVTGPRQVGKSTVLTHHFQDYQYISLDDRLVLQALSEDPVGFIRGLRLPAILDEIQRAQDCLVDIKYVVDKEKRKGIFFLSGSQKYELMSGISESLAGRVGIVELLGLSMRELVGCEYTKPFLPTSEYMNERSACLRYDQTKLWELIHRGSMPELNANEDIDWERYYASYVTTYIERDVRDIVRVGDTLAYVKFMTALAARTGELLNLHSMANDVGIDDKTAKSWLSVLEISGLVYMMKPFSLNLTKRAIKTPKVYFTDTGLVSYLCRWLTPDTLKNGAQAGNIFETFVVSEILKSYQNAGREAPMYFFRTTNNQEIDIILYQDGTIYPVEIKKTASPTVKNIRHFDILNTYFPQIPVGDGGVICSYDEVLPLKHNHRIIPVNMI